MSTPGLEEDVTEKFKGAFRHHPAGVADIAQRGRGKRRGEPGVDDQALGAALFPHVERSHSSAHMTAEVQQPGSLEPLQESNVLTARFQARV